MAEEKCAQRVCDRLRGFLDEAGAPTRTNGGQDVDRQDARQPGQRDHKSKRELRIVRLSQNNQRQLSPETVQGHDCDVSDEEYDERAQGEEMEASCALPSVKDFDEPREASGDRWGHRHSGGNAERREQEYDCRVAQLL